jgi:hypothetical protein
MDFLKSNVGWSLTSKQVFWGEIAPYEHVVQIYEDDDIFLDLLSDYVCDGMKANESVIVIATNGHLNGLNQRLEAKGYSMSELVSKNVYFPLDAEETLSQFMINDWPDENLFNQVIGELLLKAERQSEKVRAFGEMVALLWAKGQVGATVRLELLWNKFCENKLFCLFCAYPASGFTQDASESVMHICGAHSKMITSDGISKKDIFFRNVSEDLVG